MPAFLDTGHAGTWRDMIANSPCLTVTEYPGAGPSCCTSAPETAPADELEASAGDFAGRGWVAGGERVAPHVGAVSQ